MRWRLLLLLLVATAGSCGAAEPDVWVARADTGALLRRPARDPGPQPPGSLLKVPLFLAVADAAPATLRTVVTCGRSSPRERSADTCWDRRGHGTIGFSRALAFSCQRYARALAGRAPNDVFCRLGLQAAAGGTALTGHDSSFRSEPLRIFAALIACVNGGYLFDLERGQLARRVPWREQAVRAVLDGMRLCAAEGTAQAARGGGSFAKTGTAAHVDSAGRADPLRTQGWAFVCRGSLAVLVRLDPGTGAQAAELAGKLLAGR